MRGEILRATIKKFKNQKTTPQTIMSAVNKIMSKLNKKILCIHHYYNTIFNLSSKI